MTKGFYLAAEFEKGRKPAVIFCSQREKPFTIDALEGTVTPKGIGIFDKKRHYMFPDEWNFFHGHTMSELNTDEGLRDWVNEVWETWCKKHNRKYSPILDKIKISFVEEKK